MQHGVPVAHLRVGAQSAVRKLASLRAGGSMELGLFRRRGRSPLTRLSLELREELPDLALGPGLGAVVTAAVDVARRVAAVERAPFDGKASLAALVGGAGELPAAGAGLGGAHGRAAVVHHEPVPHRAPARDVERAVAGAVNAELRDGLRAAVAAAQDPARVARPG